MGVKMEDNIMMTLQELKNYLYTAKNGDLGSLEVQIEISNRFHQCANLDTVSSDNEIGGWLDMCGVNLVG